MHEDKCETVEIVSPESPDGFIVINKSDYDSAVHKIFGDKQTGQVGAKKVKK